MKRKTCFICSRKRYTSKMLEVSYVSNAYLTSTHYICKDECLSRYKFNVEKSLNRILKELEIL